MKRPLDKKEKDMCLKSLARLTEEMEWCLYQLKYHDLMLGEGLKQNYLKNIRDFKRKKMEHEQELEMIENNVRILKKQIREGVEIKEEKSKKEVKESGE